MREADNEDQCDSQNALDTSTDRGGLGAGIHDLVDDRDSTILGCKQILYGVNSVTLIT